MPAGRPRGTTSAKRKPKEVVKYRCHCCLEEKKEDDFYKSPYTRVWNETGKRVLFCKSCIDKIMTEYSSRYNEKIALIICCALLDIPFCASAYQGVIENNAVFSVGMYTRLLNGNQYRNKTFASSVVDGELTKTEDTIKDEREAKWSQRDKQNKKFVISIVGYDPFEDSNMTDMDKKYCYNILASYCDTEGIKDDGHKIQSVIELTQSQLQARKINEALNAELLNISPDEESIKKLTLTKSQIQTNISNVASDNGILTSASSSNKKENNTLSGKMKEMFTNGYDAVQVNLFDIKTSEAIKQIADISNQSIMEQLSWDANDYTEMIKQQREVITSQNTELESLREELRVVKNNIAQKGKVGA